MLLRVEAMTHDFGGLRAVENYNLGSSAGRSAG